MKFQDAPFEKQTVRKTMSCAALLALAFLISFGTAVVSQPSVYAQDNQTEIEKQLNKSSQKNKNGTRLTTPVKKPKKEEPVQPKVRRKVVAINKSKDKFPPLNVEERQQVIIKTGAVAVEIWSDGKQLGVSDNTAKLIASLTSGEHEIVARKYDKALFEPVKIIVSPQQNNFDFSGSIAKAVDEIRQNQPPENPDKDKPVKIVDAKAILKNYQEPETSDSVTLQDWQAVYEQCRSSVEIGNTDNNIEALCSFAQGQIELALGNRPKAVSLFSAAVVFLPNSPILHYGLAVAQVAAGNTEDATGSFLKAIKLDNKFALAYKELGKIYQTQDRPKEAATFFQQALRLGVNSPDLRLKIAETQIKNKNCAGAVKDLEILRNESPTVAGLMSLSYCYVEQKRAVSAIEVLNKAIELEPNSAVVHYRIGLIYLKQKEFSLAKESLERVLALDPEGKAVSRKELQELIEKAQKRVVK